MRRNIFLILIIISTAIICFYFGSIYQETKAVNIIETKKEHIERCPTFEEYENNKKLYKQTPCLVSFNETFTKEKVKTAINFSQQLKYAYKHQDMELLADIISYPLYINQYRNKNIVINSKDEFLKLDKNIILNKSIYNDINDNKLFWNYQGFILGNGKIIFWIDEKVSDIVINI